MDPGADPQAHLAGQLRDQARSCAAMGSPLYAWLLDQAALDVLQGGAVFSVLAPHLAPGRGDALALRLMAAVHRLVLSGEAPELARHYPSAGGDGDPPGAWADFRALLAARPEAVEPLVRLPCQTNEVGRCAALIGGFLAVAASTGLPLRVLEVGASAGLNLHFDRFRYGGGGGVWGPSDSPVDLDGHWRSPPPHLEAPLVVAERRGCDRAPTDPTTEEGRLALAASVWADQRARHARLKGAIALARRFPVAVEQASLEVWTEEVLAEPRPGLATVLYHSVVEEYLPDPVRTRFHQALREAGARATPEAPLAWLRLEPISRLRSHGVTLTTWPGGEERVLGTCGAHGTDVAWAVG